MRKTQKRFEFWLKGSRGDRIAAVLASCLRDAQSRVERNKDTASMGSDYLQIKQLIVVGGGVEWSQNCLENEY